jgi:hypothetical protein
VKAFLLHTHLQNGAQSRAWWPQAVDLAAAKTLHGGYLGSFVRVCPRVQSVEHGQLRVIDDVNGVVESIGRILLGPIRVSCRGLGVQMVGPPLGVMCQRFGCATSRAMSVERKA